jgi:hypothetical protein
MTNDSPWQATAPVDVIFAAMDVVGFSAIDDDNKRIGIRSALLTYIKNSAFWKAQARTQFLGDEYRIAIPLNEINAREAIGSIIQIIQSLAQPPTSTLIRAALLCGTVVHLDRPGLRCEYFSGPVVAKAEKWTTDKPLAKKYANKAYLVLEKRLVKSVSPCEAGSVDNEPVFVVPISQGIAS